MDKNMKIEYPDTPIWEPLQAAVGSRCREFMFMGKVGPIYLYKHIWTRDYLNLDGDGHPYRFTGDGYEQIPSEKAINEVFGEFFRG